MGELRLWLIFVIGSSFGFSVFASELEMSGESDKWDNPFLAYGFDPKNKIVTGYLAALRTAPGRTDECKLVFKGKSDRLKVKYLEREWVAASRSESEKSVIVITEKNEPTLKFPRESLGGDCDWILPFTLGSPETETDNTVTVTMRVPNVGSWIGVYVISSRRAIFHAQPNKTSMRKEYLVRGDVIYVYDERPDWYFVQYENGKKKAVGWIKKADTVQP